MWFNSLVFSGFRSVFYSQKFLKMIWLNLFLSDSSFKCYPNKTLINKIYTRQVFKTDDMLIS